jgi:ribosomal protein S18 acetylase RimI-like enzyme
LAGWVNLALLATLPPVTSPQPVATHVKERAITSDGARICDAADAGDVVDILVGAFHDDPTWSWVFPNEAMRPLQLRTLWAMFVDGAMRYPGCWLSDGNTAAAVWIPPGGSELSAEQEADLESVMAGVLGSDAEVARLMRVFEAFEGAHPHGEPHYYLSLLGTDVGQRGHGHGLALLDESLRAVDAAQAPAYLEASNPANVALYERFGFKVVGSFALPDDGGEVATMWRNASTG